MGCFSKTVLGVTCYRILDLVGRFGGGSQEARICSRLEIGCCQEGKQFFGISINLYKEGRLNR